MKQNTVKIGILSENGQHDTEGVKTLLRQHRFKNDFNKTIQFISILPNRVYGSKLESSRKIKVLLEEEYTYKQPKLMIFTKDLDSDITDYSKIKDSQSWFNGVKSCVSCDSIFYLAVQKIEALILSDMQNAYGKMYKKTPMSEQNPDKFIQKYGYEKNQLPDILKKIKIDNVRKKHTGHELSFDTFVSTLEAKIKRLK